MRVSVALGTYNGTAHLAEQLASIIEQARPPDEIVVCDDCSTDGTGDVLRRLAANAPLPIRIEINSQNLGSTRNFERAIALCSGDIIALSDQDDVWLPDKLASLAAIFETSPTVGLAVSDALLVDEQLRPLGDRLWPTIPFTAAEQDRAERGEAALMLTRRTFSTGATSAFRADLRDLVLPIPRCWVHDGWIGLIAAAVSEVRLIRKPLIYYRQHTGQQIGTRPRSFWSRIEAVRRRDATYFENWAECFEEAHLRLATFRPRLTRSDLPELVAERAEWDRGRARMRRGGRLARPAEVLRQSLRGRYRRFGLGKCGWQSLVADLLL